MKGAVGFQGETGGSLPLVVVANATNSKLKADFKPVAINDDLQNKSQLWLKLRKRNLASQRIFCTIKSRHKAAATGKYPATAAKTAYFTLRKNNLATQ